MVIVPLHTRRNPKTVHKDTWKVTTVQLSTNVIYTETEVGRDGQWAELSVKWIVVINIPSYSPTPCVY